MAPTIRIDEAVYAWLQQQARPFEDTPNSVLRRIAKLDEPVAVREARASTDVAEQSDHGKTPQQAYREPILKILLERGGQASRVEVLEELEKKMARQLTSFDREPIKSGDIRWQKTAEWQVHLMRKAGLVQPADDTPRGIWILTKKGEAAAQVCSQALYPR
jgi:hypothetical protein